jgi:hypothetical protein
MNEIVVEVMHLLGETNDTRFTRQSQRERP